MIPKIEITDEGIIAPTTEQINTGTWTQWDSDLGGNLSRVQGSPQYQLITSETAIIKDAYDKMIFLGNQFDPRYAVGIFQDAIGEVYFMTRKLATHSVCPVVFEGLSGVVIPNNFAIQDLTGRTWRTSGEYNIGANAKVTITCICETAGAIEALPNSITVIPSALNGLDRIYNEDSAVIGYDEESRIDFNVRRRESVAVNGKMTDDAVRGAVLAVRNVVDCYAISNPTDQTVTFGATNYPAIRNSIVVSVVGGTDYDVARAAFIKGGTGCAWNGNTDVTVIAEGYDFSPPEYPIKILRPDFVDIYIKIIVVDKNIISFTTEREVKDSILSRASSGENRVRINKAFIPADYICGLPKIGLKSIVASFDGINWQDALPIGLDQYPSIDAFRISIEEG
jgi:hypothetical protein